jgi:biotin carboxyl carrier protein
MKSYKFKINNNDFSVDITSVEDNIINLEVNGTAFQVEMEKTLKPVTKTPRVVSNPTVSQNAKTAPVASAAVSKVEAPLPGVILDIKVNVGDTVKKGQTIIILEAMKMENNINADKDGTVTAISVNKGDSVLEGSVLVTIE